MKFSVKDLFSKSEQMRKNTLGLFTFTKKKSLTKNFIFCAVYFVKTSFTTSEAATGRVLEKKGVFENFAKFIKQAAAIVMRLFKRADKFPAFSINCVEKLLVKT